MANMRRDARAAGVTYGKTFYRPVSGGRRNTFQKKEWRRALGLAMPTRCTYCRVKTRQLIDPSGQRRCLSCKRAISRAKTPPSQLRRFFTGK